MSVATAQRIATDTGRVRHERLYGTRGERFRCGNCGTFQVIPGDVPYAVEHDDAYSFDCGTCRSVYALTVAGAEEVVFELAARQSEWKPGTSSSSNIRPIRREVEASPEDQDGARVAKLLADHPPLKEVWEADAAYRAAKERRLEALRTAQKLGVSLRTLSEEGSDGGYPLPESKSALHRLLKPTIAAYVDNDIPF